MDGKEHRINPIPTAYRTSAPLNTLSISRGACLSTVVVRNPLLRHQSIERPRPGPGPRRSSSLNVLAGSEISLERSVSPPYSPGKEGKTAISAASEEVVERGNHYLEVPITLSARRNWHARGQSPHFGNGHEYRIQDLQQQNVMPHRAQAISPLSECL